MSMADLGTVADFKAYFDNQKMLVSCLCGSKCTFKIMEKDRYGIADEPAFCFACGHVFLRRRLAEKGILEFYASSAYRELYSNGKGLKSREALEPRLAFSRNNLVPLLKSFFPDPTAMKVGEWGCGGGWNLAPLKELGAEVQGFDYDREYIKFGASTFGLSLTAIVDQELIFKKFEQKFDFLIVNHVLEHVVDPLPLLFRLSKLVKPNGFIYVGLPFLENIPIWEFKPFFHIGHLHYFGFEYFKQLSVSFGLRVKLENVKKGFIVFHGQSEAFPMTKLAASYPKTRISNALVLGKYWLKYEAWLGPIKFILSRFPQLKALLKAMVLKIKGG
jgi:SAM-dependent methyltransferase